MKIYFNIYYNCFSGLFLSPNLILIYWVTQLLCLGRSHLSSKHKQLLPRALCWVIRFAPFFLCCPLRFRPHGVFVEAQKSEIILYFNSEICMHHYIIFSMGEKERAGGEWSHEEQVARNLFTALAFLHTTHTRINSRLVDMQNGWAKYNENNLYASAFCENVCVETIYNRNCEIVLSRLPGLPSSSLVQQASMPTTWRPPPSTEIKRISFNDLSQSSDRVTWAIKSLPTGKARKAFVVKA